MSDTSKRAKKIASAPAAKRAGRSFTISMKGIPKVDATVKARLEAAARCPSSKKRNYPIVAL